MKVQDDFLYIKRVKIWMKRVQETQRRSTDVEDVTIERSIQMREGAKTEIHEKLIV